MRKYSLTRHHYQSVDWERLIAILTGSLSGLRQLGSLTLAQPGQMGDGQNGSKGRGDLDDLVPGWADQLFVFKVAQASSPAVSSV